MLAVTAGAFLLVTWGAMKAVFLASFGLPLVKVADLTKSDANLLASVYRVTNKAVAHLTFKFETSADRFALIPRRLHVTSHDVEGALLFRY